MTPGSDGCALDCSDGGRLTNLFGGLRWLEGREAAGLAGLLKHGERGLGVATRLSGWFGTTEIRRSQEEEGRRAWDTCGSFSATGAGGLVKVWPRRRSLTGANKDDLLLLEAGCCSS